MQIDITQTDIDNGIPNDCRNCAIAKGLKRAFNLEDNVEVNVDFEHVTFNVNGVEIDEDMIESETDLCEFIEDFDSCREQITGFEHTVKPFSFTINKNASGKVFQ